MTAKRREFIFRVEMATGQMIREVHADGYHADGHWVRFNRGSETYWIANQSHVVSIEFKRSPQ